MLKHISAPAICLEAIRCDDVGYEFLSTILINAAECSYNRNDVFIAKQ